MFNTPTQTGGSFFSSCRGDTLTKAAQPLKSSGAANRMRYALVRLKYLTAAEAMSRGIWLLTC